MNDSEIIAKYKKYEPFFKSWHIKRFIGEGGFAKVFEIARNDFGTEYVSALKIITVAKTKTEIQAMQNEGMSEDDIMASLYGIVEDTVKEIQLMYKLKGSWNIVGYEDHEVVRHSDGMGWDILIKMELLTPLSGYIRLQRGQLLKRDIVKLGIDMCRALETCQKYNIIHRDIKADNIFISKNGEFKLGDFGIARIIERKDAELSKKGTFTHMAPEVYKGQTYTSAVDIYSLGIVLYRLLNNNRAPFLPDYPAPISLDARDHAMMLRMSGEKFPKPAQAGKSRLTEIVLKACAYRPEERYSSPVIMRQELEAILLDPSEDAADERIMVYEERAGSTSHSFSGSGGMSGGIADETKATEVLRDDVTGATEVLRDDATGATEALRGEMPKPPYDGGTAAGQQGYGYGVPQPENASDIKVLCPKCKSPISIGTAFCPVCGASQNGGRHKAAKLRGNGSWSPRKKAIIGILIGAAAGICVLLLAIGIYNAVETFSAKNDSGEYAEEDKAAEKKMSDNSDSDVINDEKENTEQNEQETQSDQNESSEQQTEETSTQAEREKQDEQDWDSVTLQATLDVGGITMLDTVTLKSKDDFVKKWIETSEFYIADYDESTRKQLCGLYDDVIAQYNAVDGVEATREITDETYTFNLMVDCTGGAVKELASQGLMEVEGNAAILSLEASVSGMQSNGYVIIDGGDGQEEQAGQSQQERQGEQTVTLHGEEEFDLYVVDGEEHLCQIAYYDITLIADGDNLQQVQYNEKIVVSPYGLEILASEGITEAEFLEEDHVEDDREYTLSRFQGMDGIECSNGIDGSTYFMNITIGTTEAVKTVAEQNLFWNINSSLSKTVQSFQEDGFVIVE